MYTLDTIEALAEIALDASIRESIKAEIRAKLTLDDIENGVEDDEC